MFQDVPFGWRHRPVHTFLCLILVVCGRDDRQHGVPGPLPAQRDGDVPPQNLPALHPPAPAGQRLHPGHAAHTDQQQLKGLYLHLFVMLLLVVETRER